MLYALMRVFLRPAIHASFKKEIEGLEHLPTQGPYLLAVNHTSYFDHFVLNALISQYRHERLYILTKSESFERPLSAWWHREMGAIPLDRSRPDLAAIRTTLNTIRQGRIVAIFPEGTRSLTGQIQSGKVGIIKLAALAGVPIVPIGLRRVFEALPPGEKIPRLSKGIGIHIGEPFLFSTPPRGEQLQKAGLDLMAEIARLADQPIPECEKLEADEGQRWIDSATWCFEQAHRDQATKREVLFWLKRAYHAACGAIKKAPDSAQAWWVYGRVLGFMGLKTGLLRGIPLAAQSRKAMEKALQLDPTYAYPYYGLGLWYEKMPPLAGGSVATSRVFYERAAELAPHEIFIQLAYARTCAKIGLKREAVEALRRVINEPPKSPEDQRRVNTATALLNDLDPDTTIEQLVFDRVHSERGKDIAYHV